MLVIQDSKQYEWVLETQPVSEKRKDIDVEVKFEYETETTNLWSSGITHWAPVESPFANHPGSHLQNL